MPIWTTTQLNELLSMRELPLRLLPAKEIKADFLANAAATDIAVIGIDDDYLTFLESAKERGLSGPILFISPEPTIAEPELHQYNAMVLDLKKMGITEVRNMVHVILGLAVRRGGMPLPEIPLDQRGAARSEDPMVEDPATIRERLNSVLKKDIPVIAALEVKEAGEPVIARGLCSIKEVRDNAIVLHRFKQSLLLKGIKKGQSLKVYFGYKQKNNGSLVVVQGTTDKEITASFPEKLFITREMRIQPNRARPVSLYVLIANEPTTNLKVMDISPRGIGFTCTRDLPMDSTYGFTIVLPDPQTIVVTSGIIRFKKEGAQGIRYGAEIQPHPWDAESIAKYIMKRETEIIGLLRST